jgi:hypothetical protein
MKACAPRDDLDAGLTAPTGRGLRVPVVDAAALTRERFRREFVRQNAPVLIRNGAARILREGALWTPDGGALGGGAHWRVPQAVALNASVHGNNAAMSLAAIVSAAAAHAHAHARTTTITMAPRCKVVGSRLCALEDGAVVLPDQCECSALQHAYFGHVDPHFWIRSSARGLFAFKVSVRGGALPHSHMDTLNVLTFGMKRWILVRMTDFATAEARLLHERHAVAQRDGNASYTRSLDWFRRQTQRSVAGDWHGDSILRQRHFDVVQSAGDVLYVPQFATHATLDICPLQMGAVLQGPLVRGPTPFFPETHDCTTGRSMWEACARIYATHRA